MFSFAIFQNERVFGVFARALLKEVAGASSRGARQVARALNREAGGLLLAASPRGELRPLAVKAAERVMRDHALVADRAKLRGHKPIKALSLGAGAQSSALAAYGERRL